MTESAPKAVLRWFLPVFGLILAVFLAVLFVPRLLATSVTVGGKTFQVEVAQTEETRRQGLSGRSSLAHDAGLLFVFDAPEQTCFWMKDMNFAIDILWFNADKRLIHQARHVSPETYPENFCPPEAAKYVLEVAAGTAEALGLQEDSELVARNL